MAARRSASSPAPGRLPGAGFRRPTRLAPAIATMIAFARSRPAKGRRARRLSHACPTTRSSVHEADSCERRARRLSPVRGPGVGAGLGIRTSSAPRSPSPPPSRMRSRARARASAWRAPSRRSRRWTSRRTWGSSTGASTPSCSRTRSDPSYQQYVQRSVFDLSNNQDTGAVKVSWGDFTNSMLPQCLVGGCGMYQNDTVTSFGSRFRGFLNVTAALAGKPLHIGFYSDDAVSLTFYDKSQNPYPLITQPPVLGAPTWRNTGTITFSQVGIYPLEILYAQIVDSAALEMSFFAGTFTDISTSAIKVPITSLSTADFTLFPESSFFQTLSGEPSYPDLDQCKQCDRAFRRPDRQPRLRRAATTATRRRSARPATPPSCAGPRARPAWDDAVLRQRERPVHVRPVPRTTTTARPASRCDTVLHVCNECNVDSDCARGHECVAHVCQWCSENEQVRGQLVQLLSRRGQRQADGVHHAPGRAERCRRRPRSRHGAGVRRVPPGRRLHRGRLLRPDHRPVRHRAITERVRRRAAAPLPPLPGRSSRSACPAPSARRAPPAGRTWSAPTATSASRASAPPCSTDRHCGARCTTCGGDTPFCSGNPIVADAVCVRCTNDTAVQRRHLRPDHPRLHPPRRHLHATCAPATPYCDGKVCVACYADTQCPCGGTCDLDHPYLLHLVPEQRGLPRRPALPARRRRGRRPDDLRAGPAARRHDLRRHARRRLLQEQHRQPRRAIPRRRPESSRSPWWRCCSGAARGKRARGRPREVSDGPLSPGLSHRAAGRDAGRRAGEALRRGDLPPLGRPRATW